MQQFTDHLDKQYTDRLMSRLKQGVQSERWGDMEWDIYSANETMTEAKQVIKMLIKELSKRGVTQTTQKPKV